MLKASSSLFGAQGIGTACACRASMQGRGVD